MKSFFILLFIVLILYIFYNFSKVYFRNKNSKNIDKVITYLIYPNTFETQFKNTSLEYIYKDMFNEPSLEVY